MQGLVALVVDDDPFVRRVVARQLTGLGAAEVLDAADGASALVLLRAGRRVDLVICDLMMPGIDGVEFVRKLHELLPEVALILISGMDRKVLATAEQAARARGMRVLGAVPKPIRQEALRALLAGVQTAHVPAQQAQVPIATEELLHAIDAGEIDIYVQPQVDARSRRLHGVEALARWISPTRGVVTPGAFIGLAERSGMIGGLSELVLRKAVEACGRWRREGLDLRISVNVPVIVLDQLGLPDRLAALATDYGLASQQLVVEITESGLVRTSAVALDVLARLRIHGIELSIDDFGTGYSMLSQLKQVPFNEMKLDQSFVSVATKDREALRMIESSQRLARDLGLRTVAEGTETEADVALMARLGCDLVQGYAIAKPMPVTELPQWAVAHAEGQSDQAFGTRKDAT